jgi:selenoprotein W-related protein
MGEILPVLKSRFSEYKLIPGTGGEFEITVDGRSLYSKLETGQFPEPRDILKKLQKL